MAGIYDDDDNTNDTDSARLAKRKNQKRKEGAKSFLANSLGSIGALIVTFLVSYAIALAMLWIAGHMVSIGGFGGLGPAGVLAIILTAVFYWYDRNNP
jgi:4-hydroxybenzoate polyprenyltransferase